MTDAYEEWQSLLVAAFLRPHEGPTVLFVDDDELARLRPESEDAALDLAEAVRARLRPLEGRSMFKPIMTTFRQWQGTTRVAPPPILPMIALAVLAATRMRSDAQARSTNYYLRLAQTLLPAEPDAVERVRLDLKNGGAFLDVVDMWRGLHAWIQAQGGTVGVSTIRDQPHLERIGYPLSQALVRQSDRMALTRFFHALGITPGIGIDAESLLRALAIWTSAAANRLSDALMRALSDPELRHLAASVIEAHAQAWDGRVLTSDGNQRIAMRLGIDLDGWHSEWLFPKPAGGPESVSLLGPDDVPEIRLMRAEGLDHYAAKPSLPVNPDHVVRGLQLRGAEFTAEFPATPVVFLRPDLYTGAWSSVPGLLPFEEHLVAVSSPHIGEFREVLREAAGDDWRPVPQRGSVLLTGFAFFQNVRFVDGTAFDHALARLPGLRRAGVATPVVPRARLVRGLPIATAISGTHFLAGGEPDLLLPSGAEPRVAVVTLDGLREELPANGFPLELRRFVTTTGRHVVDIDGQVVSFTTLEEGPDAAQPPGVGSIGWNRSAQLVTTGEPATVSGALVVGVHDHTEVLARRSRDESWLLHEDGTATNVPEPATPTFLSTLDIDIHSPWFEIQAVGTARWLAQRRGKRWHLTEVGPADPHEYDVEIDVLGAWRRACSDPNSAQLWQMQLNMAARTV